MITVRGYSDDTIELCGDVEDEIDAIDGNHKLTFDDGTVLHVRYHTEWRITVDEFGGHIDIVTCPEGDEDNYSDVALLHSATSLTKHEEVDR